MRASSALPRSAELALAALARDWAAVEVMVLFGSAARGQLADGSDVDVYLRLSLANASEGRAAVDDFARAASAVCGREIDVVVESPSTSVILRREVASKGRPLFERRPGAFRALVVDAVRAYVDLEPQLRSIGAAIRARAVSEGTAAAARLSAREAARGR